MNARLANELRKKIDSLYAQIEAGKDYTGSMAQEVARLLEEVARLEG